MTQWVLGGVLGYAPLLGIPSPADLHREDAALHRLLHAGLGVRNTSERVSLSAPRSAGGLGIPLLSEMLVAAVASDLLLLLNGTSQAADLARDSLRAALDSPPAELPRHCGLVATALHFLAGYGLYLNVSTDRFISRLLDNLNPAPTQPLHGPFHPSRFEAAARFARCGTIANSVAQDVPPSRWGEAELWSNLLPEHLPLSSQACARAARAALQQADSDWQQECLIFHVAAAPAPPEDWRDVAWEDPWLPSGDPRSGHLLTPFPGFTAPPDFALFGDGGFSAAYGATFCSQARGFGRTGHY